MNKPQQTELAAPLQHTSEGFLDFKKKKEEEIIKKSISHQ